jgi:DNA-binding MurR/RpiR family transcriptional regulator
MANQTTEQGGSSIIQIIRDHYNDLSDTHRKVADFILQNLEKATFSSLMEISEETGVSDASIIRFARELGFKGYQELRDNLIDYIRKIIYPKHKSTIFGGQNQHPLIDLVMKKDIEYITKTMTNVDNKDFDTLIKYIFSAKRIFCMGWGYSSFLAEFLAFGLRFLSYEAFPVIRERRPLVQQVMFLKENDILIVFDLLLYSTEVLEAVEHVYSKGKNTKIVTITNGPLAHVVEFSDLNFFCDLSGHEFQIISLSAPMCFINCILEMIVAKNPKKADRAMHEFQRVVMPNTMYYSQIDPKYFEWKTGIGKQK